MPPRPRSPRIRYRPPNNVPGANRPSSTTLEAEEVSCEISDLGDTDAAAASAVSATVSSEVGVTGRSMVYRFYPGTGAAWVSARKPSRDRKTSELFRQEESTESLE